LENNKVTHINKSVVIAKKKVYSKRYKKENIELYTMLMPVLIFLFIFSYMPMYGLVIAFQNYTPGSPFLAFDGSVEWVGLKHFIDFASSIYFGRILRNTILLSLYGLIFGFWVPIAFAILLNEVRMVKYKKFIQTASYMPYFISSVVVAGMVLSFINVDGLINNIMSMFGSQRVSYNLEPKYFPIIYTFTNIWRSFGWNSILYLCTMSAIDLTLYESAKIDGANRFHQIIYITIPHIKPIIAINLIFAMGSLLSSNSDLILLMYNSSVYSTADVIDTYVYRAGLLEGQFSFGTAVGLLIALINFTLVFCANKVSNKLTDFGLW